MATSNLRNLPWAGIYATAMLWSLLTSYLLRFDFDVPTVQIHRLPSILAWMLPLKIVLLYAFRQQHVLSHAFGLSDLSRLLYPLALSSAITALVTWYSDNAVGPPAGVIVIDLLCSFGALLLVRLALRWHRQRLDALFDRCQHPNRRIGIIGAGEAGSMLAAELQSRKDIGLEPIAFFDDDSSKWFSTVCNIPIVGAPEALLTAAAGELQLEEILLSLPSASGQRIREIILLLQKAKLPYRTVPSLSELAMGKVQVSQVRPVEVQDLLGRPPIKLDTKNIQELLGDRVVMVTGAGGSIGGELCRQIASFNPRQILLIERSEVQLFVIEQELIRGGYREIITPCVADVVDLQRMRALFEKHRPTIVFHAAAHKHVPLMESQPAEAIRNNALGTARLSELAVESGVERFVLISTDKAINPTSVMGATKRLAEMFLQSLHAAGSRSTRLMAVRFGNVLGSSGSVIPIFKEQIARGGPLTVTDPEASRYFMTIPEAAGLVLQSAAQGDGGEVFLLDMGKPVKIVDLARQLIVLSGLEPDTDIQIEFVGLRPGEKLIEELTYQQEHFIPTSHPKIRRFSAPSLPLQVLQGLFREFSNALTEASGDRCRTLLTIAIPEYQPDRAGEPLPEPSPRLLGTAQTRSFGQGQQDVGVPSAVQAERLIELMVPSAHIHPR